MVGIVQGLYLRFDNTNHLFVNKEEFTSRNKNNKNKIIWNILIQTPKTDLVILRK